MPNALMSKSIPSTAVRETRRQPSIVGGVLAIPCQNGSTFATTLNQNITGFLVSGIPASGTMYVFLLDLTMDGTPRTITWSFNGVVVRWASGVAPTLTAGTLGKRDIFTFLTHDGGVTWVGATVSQNV